MAEGSQTDLARALEQAKIVRAFFAYGLIPPAEFETEAPRQEPIDSALAALRHEALAVRESGILRRRRVLADARHALTNAIDLLSGGMAVILNPRSGVPATTESELVYVDPNSPYAPVLRWTPTSIQIEWHCETDVPLPDLIVIEDAETAEPLSQVVVPPSRAGEAELSPAELGFDPTRRRWRVRLLRIVSDNGD